MRGQGVATAMAPVEVPALPRSPLVGNIFDLQRDRLGLLRRVLEECGEAGSFHLGRRPIYVFTSPEYAKAILVDNWETFEKGPMLRSFARPFLGDGLLSCGNDVHRRRRKLVAPAFQPQRLARYVDMMTQTVEESTHSWRDGERVDLHKEMLQITLRVIGRTLFSADLVHEGKELGRALDVGMEYVSDRLKNPLHLPLLFPTPKNLRVRKAVTQLNELIGKLVKERREAGEDKGDVLSMMLLYRDEGGDHLSDAEIRDELVTFFLAGFETVTNGLAWTWSFLAQSPGCVRKLQEEVDQVLGDRLPSWADLGKLSYCLQAFKEALRIYPPAHTIGRQAAKRVAIGDYVLPEDSIILVCPYLMHRRREVFPDPERFDPDRFLENAEQSIPRNTYIPFGMGPRVCIGSFFALTEAQVVISTIARRFNFVLEGSPPEPETLMTIRPKGGLPVVVHRRSC